MIGLFNVLYNTNKKSTEEYNETNKKI